MIVQYGAGGGVDTVIRAACGVLERILGSRFVVINMPGAVGSLASAEVFRRPADGYTLLGAGDYSKSHRVLGLSTTVPWKDWQYYKLAGSIPAWSVRYDSPYKTIADVVEDALARPGKVRVSTSGIGGAWHEATLIGLGPTGAEFTYVPYSGGAEAALAGLRGDVEVIASGVHEVVQFLRADQLRTLAVFSQRPIEVPGVRQPLRTLAESLPGVAVGGLDYPMVLGFKRDVDPSILKKLEVALQDAVADPDFTRVLHERVIFPDFLSGAEADREAAYYESLTAWTFWEHQLPGVRVDPSALGIPRPENFEQWWPPTGYRPAIP
ncbi:tripartite tricarboxylate transporter substrate binding protein [Geochorda subterranea]|uniref:Tripartite tricarboxylate transporter substrate binding protein n=1 Tax=Geochorda subterranea TaxID=3109564 RepID=A0ABZ1BR84_9FIRM|nr:tripartite tricarboxylate transporter substrate binding protein [Limnochorda sp. LNt]WRP15020.1 tripartite tricarboxylate transporter substrate binding protein [Limnochorda sp. LNt]